MTARGLPPDPTDRPSAGAHLATVGHAGRFWDVYVEFRDDPAKPDTFRALLCFSPADRDAREQPVRTTTIIIEPSYEEAMARARALQEHQLLALLRSCLPG
jgi:hypothetical protein